MSTQTITEALPKFSDADFIAEQRQPFAAILSDMDGTMVDTEPLWFNTEVLMMANYGLEWTEEDQIH